MTNTLSIASTEIKIAEDYQYNTKERNKGKSTLFPVFLYNEFKLNTRKTGRHDGIDFEVIDIPCASYLVNNTHSNIIIKRSNIFEIDRTLRQQGVIGIQTEISSMIRSFPLAKYIYVVDDYRASRFDDKEDCVWTPFASEYSKELDKFGKPRYMFTSYKRLKLTQMLFNDVIAVVNALGVEIKYCDGVRYV